MAFFSSIANYVRRRRRGLAIAVGFAGGAYLVAQYALERFRETQARLVRSKNAKANLVRRFLQNQEDCVLTVSALLTTLSGQIFSEISVESITEQLQKLAQGTVANTSTSEGTSDNTAGEGATMEQQHTQAALPPSPPRSPSQEEDSKEKAEQNSKDASNDDDHHGYTTDSTDSVASYHIPPSTISDSTSTDGSVRDDCNNDDSRTPIIGADSGVIINEKDGVPHSPVSEGTITSPAYSPPSKAELWNQIKILSFTRAVTSVYSISLLVIQTHIQLSLLGRYKYVGSVVSQVAQNSRLDGPIRLVDDNNNQRENSNNETSSSRMNLATERAYLTFSWWLLYKGWREIRDKVQSAVEETLADKQLKTEISNDDFVRMISKIRQKVELNGTASPHSFAYAVFPGSKESESEVLRNGGLPELAQNIDHSPHLRQLLDETADILECPDFLIVQQACFDAAFGTLFSSLDATFFTPRNMPPTSSAPTPANGYPQPRMTEFKNLTCKLASILPTVSKEAHTILRSLPNEYVECCSDVRELKEFCAIIYSAWESEDVDLFNSSL